MACVSCRATQESRRLPVCREPLDCMVAVSKNLRKVKRAFRVDYVLRVVGSYLFVQ